MEHPVEKPANDGPLPVMPIDPPEEEPTIIEEPDEDTPPGEGDEYPDVPGDV